MKLNKNFEDEDMVNRGSAASLHSHAKDLKDDNLGEDGIGRVAK